MGRENTSHIEGSCLVADGSGEASMRPQSVHSFVGICMKLQTNVCCNSCRHREVHTAACVDAEDPAWVIESASSACAGVKDGPQRRVSADRLLHGAGEEELPAAAPPCHGTLLSLQAGELLFVGILLLYPQYALTACLVWPLMSQMLTHYTCLDCRFLRWRQ